MLLRSAMLALLFLVVSDAPRAGAEMPDNSIGIYTDQGGTSDDASYWGPPGIVEAYVVLLNPRNFNLGGTGADGPITIVGGFEFRIEMPPSAVLLGSHLPPQTYNFRSVPEFFCGTNLPVVGDHATCVTLEIGAFAEIPAGIRLVPVQGTPSIPDHLAITDHADEFRLNPAWPASGSFAEPVFGLWQEAELAVYTPQWSIRIVGHGDGGNVLGAGRRTTDAYDPELEAVDDNLAITFVRPDWRRHFPYFKHDFRGIYDTARSSKSWDFTFNVPTTLIGTITTITFAPSFDPADGAPLTLTDHATGHTVRLGSDPAYTFLVVGHERNFTLTVGAVDPAIVGLEVGITAGVDSLVSAGIAAATAEGATDGFDIGLDTPLPPPPPGNYVHLSFKHPDWPLGPRFSRDVRALYDCYLDERTWPILVETDRTGTLELRFTPGFAGDVALRLRDVATGRVHDLWPDLAFTTGVAGPAALRFELIVGGVTTPPLSPESRDIPAGWSLLSPPLIPPSGREDCGSVILGLAPGTAYAYGFLPGTGYETIAPEQAVGVGQGFWLVTDEAFVWTMDGRPALDPVLLGLVPGWNLLGYPLWFPGPVEGTRVRYGSASFSWQDALDANLVTGFVGYDTDGRGYDRVSALEPWNGYWIAALEEDVALEFAWQDFIAAGKTPDPAATTPAGGWRTALQLRTVGRLTGSVVLGADPLATDGFDAGFDLPQPPPAPAGGPAIAILRPDLELRTGSALSVDLVAPLDDRDFAWELRIIPDGAAPLELAWDRTGWPADLDWELRDCSGVTVCGSMRDQDRLALGAPTGPVYLTMVRTAAPAQGVPFAGYALRCFPNPFNPQTTITFALPGEGRAEVRIYSVRGELVDVLGGGVLAAGTHRFTWRGTDRAGRAVPSGSYFARLLSDGEHAGETAKMSLIR